MAISATTRVPLVYDFYGFPEHYYQMTYDAPGAPELGERVRRLMSASEPVLERPTRGLDHGAWVPLKAMYPEATIPVLQLSMPDLDPGTSSRSVGAWHPCATKAYSSSAAAS
jgi:4,5-DOPA dioxygenase extradiol